MAPNSRQRRQRKTNRSARDAKTITDVTNMLLGNGVVNQRSPPNFVSGCVIHRHIRYIVKTALTDAAVTYQNLLDTFNVSMANGTTLYQIGQFVKLNEIRMWLDAASLTAPAFCSVEYPGFGPATKHLSSALGGAMVSELHSRPPKRTQVGFWQPTSATNAFRLTAPVGTIIDISVSFAVPDDPALTPPNNCTNVGVAGQPGQFYQRGLDGVATAGTSYTVIGFPQI